MRQEWRECAGNGRRATSAPLAGAAAEVAKVAPTLRGGGEGNGGRRATAAPLADAQKKEIDRRLEAYHQNPDEGFPWGMVRDRIRRNR